MNIKVIHYTDSFEKQFLLLPKDTQKKAVKAEVLFQKNAFYPSLRLHKLEGRLSGLWSISLDRKYRIIFKAMNDGVILFVSIGLHAIYDSK